MEIIVSVVAEHACPSRRASPYVGVTTMSGSENNITTAQNAVFFDQLDILWQVSLQTLRKTFQKVARHVLHDHDRGALRVQLGQDGFQSGNPAR